MNAVSVRRCGYIIERILIESIGFLIRLYQKTVSNFLPRTCRFEPSCSNYTIGALRRYGLFIGIVKSLYRIIRCNPFFPGGYDPV